MAPRPTNANCPSDSCPAHPVRTVTESVTTAKSSIRENRNACDAVDATSGSRMPTATAAPGSRKRRRDLPASESEPARAVSDQLPPASTAIRRPRHSTRTTATRSRTTSVVPGFATLENSTDSTRPIAMPPATVHGRETKPPMRTAMRARRRSPGPRASDGTPATVAFSGFRSTAVSVARTPARTQTELDTRRIEMPASCAESAFSAVARMAMPIGCRVSRSAIAAMIAGAKSSTMKCSLRRKRSPTCRTRSMGVGYGPGRSTSGRASWAKKSSWETPMVATSMTKRGRSKSRRTTKRSTARPTTPPTRRATASATKKFTPWSSTSFARTAAPKAPISPWARLITRVARYTRTSPMPSSA